MKRATGTLAVVLMISLLAASDVRAGSAGAPAGKTTGSSVTATIVMDVTGSGTAFPKGLTSVRIQRSGASAAALFTSGVVFGVSCATVKADINGRFVGNMNGWVPLTVRTALFGAALAEKAVIVDTDYTACTSYTTAGGDPLFLGATREALSFTAVIQFEK
jgi:hypothetical protein